jgi:RHS repeat-associated protein
MPGTLNLDNKIPPDRSVNAVVRAILCFFWLIIAATPLAAQTLAQLKPVSIDEADRILRARMPSVVTTTTSPAAPGEARTLRPNALTSGSSAGCASGSSQPIEIVTLAASLKCDLDLIYEYVYSNIEYEPLFGSNKGALGTLLDQRGNDVDQAQLFVALLNAAGITQTNFIYGYISLTGPSVPSSPCTAITIASAPSWLGVNNDGLAILNLVANGGIPFNIGSFSNNSDGTLNCVDVAHVWVQVTIAGINYVFDPSFKQHVVTAGLANLGGLLGYSQSQFLTDSGGTTDAVSISNINRTKVRSDLTTYANTLIGNILSHTQQGLAPYTLNDVIGGKTIIPLSGSPIRQTSLPYFSNNQPSGFPQNWGASVPNAYRTCFTLSMPGIAPTQCGSVSSQTVQLFADQTYGQRITVFSEPDPTTPGNYIPTLLIGGAVPSNGQSTGTSVVSGAPWTVSVCILHAYVEPDANVCSTTPPPVAGAGVLTIAAGGSYLISAGWGRVGRGMVQKHRQLLAQALAAPGANPASELVLGESLSVISYNWLAETAAQLVIGDAIAQVSTLYHHGVGITGQSAIQNSGSQGPYVDLPLNFFSIKQQTCWPNSSCPFPAPIIAPYFTSSATASSLESAVLLQTQAPTPNMTAASTIALVDSNAANGAKTFFADGTTSAGQSNYINLIRPTLQPGTPPAYPNYSQVDITAIDMAVTGASPPPASPSPTQSQVLLPANGQIAIGLWKGAGYTIILQSGSQLDITQKISGGLSGGYTGTDVTTPAQTSNTNQTIPTPAAAANVPSITNGAPAVNNTTISEPIDAVTGAEIYTNTDLVIGSGAFPYALPFARTYTSSSNLTDVGLGSGWTHSYGLSATVNSDPYEGMGASSPIRAAAAIAATYVSQQLLSGSSQSAQSLTLAWMVDRWFTDQITNNAALITHPSATEEFIALPQTDGQITTAYNPPFGSAVVLTGTGAGSGLPTTFTYTNKDRTILSFAPVPGSESSSPISSWTTPNGMQVNFSYNSYGQLTMVANNLNRSLSLSYAGTIGGHVGTVSDGSRSVTFGYTGNNLTTATDPLSNQTIYAYDTSGNYDTAGHLTQVFYPNAPAVPFVTNYYDGLGRVSRQLNANGQPTQFYFAGSRTETADAVGDRHITYQTPRSKIIRDAAVLSASFGDVFNDTSQQNGIVNVTSTQYDGLDRVVLTTAPEGGTVGYSYSPDLENNIVAITKTARPGSSLTPLTTTYTYDPAYNKPASITDPLGLVTKFVYNQPTGNLVTATSDAGVAGHFNATSSFSYNIVGQVLTALDPLQARTQFSYDAFGNQTSVIRDCCGAGHSNQTVTMAYNAFGDVISAIDPNNNKTTNTFDANRRRLTITSPATAAAPGGVVTTFTYDPVGQLLNTSQSAGSTVLRQTSTTYTPTGKISTTTDANTNITHYAYDADDRLASTTDAVGRQTTYAYDAMTRRISVSKPAIQASPLLQQAYTPDGLVASFTNANGFTTSFAPDGFDRLATTTYPDSSTQVLAYDADGNVLSRQTRAGAAISFTYDTLNRLSTKATPSEPTVTYSYDLAGHPLGVVDNSAAIVAPSTAGTIATVTSTYDSLNKLTGSVWGPTAAQTAPSLTSAIFTYSYDATNRRVSQTATDNSYWSYPVATASTVSYTANNLDQYSAIGSVTPTYDGNGNLTFDGTFTYGYDAESRLVSASGAGNTASYAYDAQGRRKSKTVNGTTTIFVQDPQGRALLDYDGTAGTIQNWYAFGSGPNDVLNQISITGATRATYIPDVQGSIVASLDASSGTLTKAGYQTYGESGVTSGTFRYTGARIDAETNGLYEFRARIYSPMLGRFMQADPIGAAGGINLYAYVNNDPLNLIDPFGLSPDSPSPTAASELALPGIGTAGEAAAGGSLAPAAALAAVILAVTSTSTAGPEQDEFQQTFFHGTTGSSALALLNGAPISIGAVQQNTLNTSGNPAFYLATDPNSAAYFGSLHSTPSVGSTVIQYTMGLSAVQTLVGQGATLGPIPQLGAPSTLPGQQFVVPSTAFSTFNTLRTNGQIVVSPFTGQ